MYMLQLDHLHLKHKHYSYSFKNKKKNERKFFEHHNTRNSIKHTGDDD